MNLFKPNFPNIQADVQNKMTLVFKDANLERRFYDYYTDRYLIHGRICHILAVVFYSLYGIFDATLFPESKQTMWFIRYAVVLPAFIFGFLYSYSNAYKNYWQLLFSGYVLLTGGGYVYMAAITPSSISYFYYTGIIFCLFFGYAFIRLRFIYSAFAGTFLTIGYIGLIVWRQGLSDVIVLNSLPYIVGINVLGMLIGYSIELTARHNFLLINDLGRVEADLRNSRDLLEKRVKERTQELENVNRLMVADRQKRVRLEEQFRQAQKMEAVGRLAGGVAHDFNNLMSIVIGYADISLMGIGPDNPVRKNLEQIKKAGERATAVTRQLLAFSRKQILQVKRVNLNEVITGIDKMLRRLIGEDIEVKAILALDLMSIEADPNQMEQVLMNLVVNARDVMPNGGKLTIETENVTVVETDGHDHGVEIKPGAYVLLAVSDSGGGMDKEIQDRIFEPFFTTKEKGRGTGLGLATVYGIVKQTGGYIWVYSEPGQGTTFKLYFPRAQTVSALEKEKPAVVQNLKGTETVLLVEDDTPVRNLVQQSLEHFGYRVLAAVNGEEALAVAKTHNGLIALLITDVVMPKMNGREVAEQIQFVRDGIRVLYMSGYTDDVIAHHGVLDAGLNFIEKPFTPGVLAQAVRKVLDGG